MIDLAFMQALDKLLKIIINTIQIEPKELSCWINRATDIPPFHLIGKDLRKK